jgi:hypothetical protein
MAVAVVAGGAQPRGRLRIGAGDHHLHRLRAGLHERVLIGSILCDRRPPRREFAWYPDICVLVACYNEGGNIHDTLVSLSLQTTPAASKWW